MPLGGGKRACGCRGCGKVFSSLTAFTRHRRRFACLDPAACGLEKKRNGRWGQPGTGKGPRTRGG